MSCHNDASPLPSWPLPTGVTSRFVDCTATCGLTFHTLTAGTPGKPLILLLHGLPELSYSWSKILAPVSDLAGGFYCVAPDLPGLGRTRGLPNTPYHEADLNKFRAVNMVRNFVSLVHTMGYTSVYSVIGNDVGSAFSTFCVLIRPDMFKSSININAPFAGPGIAVLGDPTQTDSTPPSKLKLNFADELAKLDPPKQHYQGYFSTEQAEKDCDNPPQGLETFLQSYYYFKSGSWPGNKVRPLDSLTPQNFAAAMPTYYCMPLGETMPEVVMKLRAEDPKGTPEWLSEAELQVFVSEYARNGFQAVLNYYRSAWGGLLESDLQLLAGRVLETPCAAMCGTHDWAVWLFPGGWACYEDPSRVKPGCFRGLKMIEGAGHYAPIEKPDAVVEGIADFFATLN